MDVVEIEDRPWRHTTTDINLTDADILNDDNLTDAANFTTQFNSTALTRNRDPLASLTFVIIYSIASFIGVIVLAIIDLMVCVALMPVDIMRKRWLWDEYFLLGIPHTIFLWLRNMSLELQVVVLVSIAVDRFFAICKPLSFTMTWKRALKTTITATTILFMLELGNACARMMYSGYHPTVDKIIKFFYMGGILIALVIMAVLYIRIYIVVVQRTKSKKTKKIGPEKSYSFSEPDLDSNQSNIPLSDTSSHQESPNNTYRGETNPGAPQSPAAKNKLSYSLPMPKSVCEQDLRKATPTGNNRRVTSDPAGQAVTPTGRYAKISSILAALPKRSLNAMTFPYKQSSRRNHIKTAKMLFLVTLVFVLSWVPPNLINLKLVPYSSLVFSLFYVNNVANPIIYSFLNKRFRDDIKRLFKRMCRK
ncbi:uncharacterized protein LOC141902370 isoform X2 [Tubulanus polymorphus]|uniref:uncharacterized protein LOC141902370 isoform X2 n=1 Tax=Tubulanus polymorphus TaxID=672921 RepID=UPI003DA640B4